MRIFLLMVFMNSFLFGQTKKIDSLKNELKIRDINKFPIYSLLIDEFTKINKVDSIFKYTDVISSYASMSKDSENIAKAELLISNMYLLKREYDNSLKSAHKSLEIANRMSNKHSLTSACYMQIAKIYYLQTDFKNTIINAEKSLNFGKLIETSNTKDILRKFYCYIFLVESYNNTGKLIKAKQNVVLLKDLVAVNNLKQFEPMVMHVECKILESLGKFQDAINLRLDYLKVVKKIDNVVRKNGNLCEGYYNLAELYNKIDLPDISKMFLDSSKTLLPNYLNKDLMTSFHNNLEAEISKKQNKLTLKQINNIIADSTVKSNTKALPFALQQKGDLLVSDRKFQEAIFNYESAKMKYLENDDKAGYLEILKNLLQVYIETGDKENAKKCLLEYEKLKDDLFGKDVATTLSDIEVKYQTKQKEVKIAEQKLSLEKEKSSKNLAYSGIGLLSILSFGFLLLYRSTQKRQKLQTQNTLLSLQQNINAMELQNLNKQLDPHEIKNLLASISPEIQEKAPDSYRKMLKLLNVTKASLGNNSLTESVENQINQIEDYLSLNKNSLSESLDYEIENKIENPEIQLPRLLLKNLVENSIKHGIKGKEGGGKIKVSLEELNNFISVKVDDTGKGRANAISSDSGIGTTTYQKLFTTLNQKNLEKASFEIIDKDQGTLVEVKIPIDYKYS